MSAYFTYVLLVYFTAIWYILLPFCIFSCYFIYIFPVLVCRKRNLATLIFLENIPNKSQSKRTIFSESRMKAVKSARNNLMMTAAGKK
jgi:hypothetical protein